MARLDPADCATMADVRAQIDRIDDDLIDLLSQRFGYIDRAWQLKRGKEAALVPWRVEEVVGRVRTRARASGLPPDCAEAVWRGMMDWFIDYEAERMGRAASDDGPDRQERGGKQDERRR